MNCALLLLLYGDPVGTYETNICAVVIHRDESGWSTTWKDKVTQRVHFVGRLRLTLGGWEETWSLSSGVATGVVFWTFTDKTGDWGIVMKRTP